MRNLSEQLREGTFQDLIADLEAPQYSKKGSKRREFNYEADNKLGATPQTEDFEDEDAPRKARRREAATVEIEIEACNRRFMIKLLVEEVERIKDMAAFRTAVAERAERLAPLVKGRAVSMNLSEAAKKRTENRLGSILSYRRKGELATDMTPRIRDTDMIFSAGEPIQTDLNSPTLTSSVSQDTAKSQPAPAPKINDGIDVNFITAQARAVLQTRERVTRPAPILKAEEQPKKEVKPGKKVEVDPTMVALHEGYYALFKRLGFKIPLSIREFLIIDKEGESPATRFPIFRDGRFKEGDTVLDEAGNERRISKITRACLLQFNGSGVKTFHPKDYKKAEKTST